MIQLQFNADTSDFEGTAVVANKPYRLSLLDLGRGDAVQALQLAIKITDWIEKHLDEIKHHRHAFGRWSRVE